MYVQKGAVFVWMIIFVLKDHTRDYFEIQL